MPGTSSTATAAAILDPGTWTSDPVSAIEHAVRGQQWLLLSGVALAIVVQLAKRLGLLERLPEGAAKWVSVGLAVAGSVAVSLQTGAPMSRTLIHALSVAWMATGAFETVGRPLHDRMPKT